MSDVIQELAELIRNNDVPDTARLRQHNIQIGLRDDQGAGVFVGVTNKGSAIGYERIPLAVLKGEEQGGSGVRVVDPARVWKESFSIAASMPSRSPGRMRTASASKKWPTCCSRAIFPPRSKCRPFPTA